ncbi:MULTISPECIES: hypothetical protein [unclassified Pseudomonas]|uniref:hypothetical protein n=1 Tax=unclassified Pseudomonas TaxID=196821 RepID=UPI0021143C6A|nr:MULTISPECIES: hypothetical protein [unclassified Pseudomonas]
MQCRGRRPYPGRRPYLENANSDNALQLRQYRDLIAAHVDAVIVHLIDDSNTQEMLSLTTISTGQGAVDMALRLANGSTSSNLTRVPFQLITPDNLASF